MTDEAIEHLRALVRIPTVSDPDWSRVDAGAFDAFVAQLRELYPRLHATLEPTVVGSHGLLFRWPGASADRPVVLMAHFDVVPIAGEWTHPPFGAEIVDTPEGPSVWGRGTLDDKQCVAGLCEAVERLLGEGFVPAQDVWLSFGCDEEVYGGAARAAVAELTRRGVTPWFVLDEGGAIAGQAFPGIAAPLGVVGVTEKGVTSVELVARGDGGHASTPSPGGPTARIARAISRIDRSPMAPHLPEPTAELFRRLAPHAPGPLRPVLAHADRLAPALTRVVPRLGAEAAALVRTTFAVTTLSGSPALNVIASEARAGVNIRVMVGDTVASALAHLRHAIADDSIAVEVMEANEPSPVSPRDEAFALLESLNAELYPDAVTTPYVMLAATDSRHFTAISERVYRFAPFRMTRAQRASIHAADEHIGVDDFLAGVDWYRRLIESLPA